MSTVTGRAMFYVFLGSFGMARLDDDFLMFLFGLGFFAVGVLILVQQWKSNRNPQMAGGQAGLIQNQVMSGP